MEKKFELTGETKVVSGVALHRIRALKDFADVKKGDLGGWVEKEENLSQEGNCWVFNNAQVFDDAQVFNNALVSGDAWVYGNAQVFDDAQVFNNAHVFNNALVSGDAWVHGNALVFGDAQVYGYAKVFDYARVYGDAKVRGRAAIYFCFNLKTGSFGGPNDKNDLFMRCPQKGSFTAFKQVMGKDGLLILEIEVPADAKRSSAAGNKCRCSKAKAVALYNLDGTPSSETTARSQNDNGFVYEIGKVAVPDSFDENRWEECSNGIHFFMSFEEARDY